MITYKRAAFAVLITIFLILGIYLLKPHIKNTKLIDFANEIIQENSELNNLEKKAEAIMKCESSLLEKALNLKDRDGTASYSYAQWKPETFRMYAIKYGVLGEKADWNWIMTIIWDYQTNKYLVMRILQNEKPEVIRNLWPYCYRKMVVI